MGVQELLEVGWSFYGLSFIFKMWGQLGGAGAGKLSGCMVIKLWVTVIEALGQ